MGKLQRVGEEWSSAARSARPAYTLFGARVASLGVLHHMTRQCRAKYYDALGTALWENVMRPVPFPADEVPTAPYTNDGPIWVLWWQGLNGETPAIIRACIDSMRRHANGRQVNVLSKNNYREYVQVDSLFTQRVESGRMSIAMFSDILRCSLLYQHGGIWLDAGMYLTEDIPTAIEQAEFYTIPSKAVNPTRKWAIYYLASVKKNPLFDYMLRCYREVFSRVDVTPDYFLTDTILLNAYEHIPQIRTMIDAVPDNNPARFDLLPQLGEPLNELHLDPQTYAYKLTYKMAEPARTVDGHPTVYGAILNNAL